MYIYIYISPYYVQSIVRGKYFSPNTPQIFTLDRNGNFKEELSSPAPRGHILIFNGHLKETRVLGAESHHNTKSSDFHDYSPARKTFLAKSYPVACLVKKVQITQEST